MQRPAPAPRRSRVVGGVAVQGGGCGCGRTGLLRNYAGIGNADLFRVSLAGTKTIIHQARERVRPWPWRAFPRLPAHHRASRRSGALG